jgi:hypothetical protein
VLEGASYVFASEQTADRTPRADKAASFYMSNADAAS